MCRGLFRNFHRNFLYTEYFYFTNRPKIPTKRIKYLKSIQNYYNFFYTLDRTSRYFDFLNTSISMCDEFNFLNNIFSRPSRNFIFTPYIFIFVIVINILIRIYSISNSAYSYGSQLEPKDKNRVSSIQICFKYRKGDSSIPFSIRT